MATKRKNCDDYFDDINESLEQMNTSNTEEVLTLADKLVTSVQLLVAAVTEQREQKRQRLLSLMEPEIISPRIEILL